MTKRYVQVDGEMVDSETVEQAMACLSCGLAGDVPDEFLPQEPGSWHNPCPQCGEMTVWVTEPRRVAQ